MDGDRKVEELRSTPACCLQKYTLTARPYFKSAIVYTAYARMIFMIALFSLILFEFIGYSFMSNTILFLAWLGGVTGLIAVVVVAMLAWRFRCGCLIGEKKNMLLLVGIQDERKVANITLVFALI